VHLANVDAPTRCTARIPGITQRFQVSILDNLPAGRAPMPERRNEFPEPSTPATAHQAHCPRDPYLTPTALGLRVPRTTGHPAFRRGRTRRARLRSR
jgi:hypothetical protein